uniref:Uncharacterized protein n=1 Tax=Oryza nivara TaxID=4536 RepID=A0A0E0G684_ORYNI
MASLHFSLSTAASRRRRLGGGPRHRYAGGPRGRRGRAQRGGPERRHSRMRRGGLGRQSSRARRGGPRWWCGKARRGVPRRRRRGNEVHGSTAVAGCSGGRRPRRGEARRH